MWRGPLNNAASATITHKRLKGVFDGTGTQVEIQMINKCRVKMARNELYNKEEPPWEGDGKKERENTVVI